MDGRHSIGTEVVYFQVQVSSQKKGTNVFYLKDCNA